MLVRSFCRGIIALALLTKAANGQTDTYAVQVPGNNDELQLVVVGFDTAEASQPLLDAIARWLATNFDLPLVLAPPRIAFTSQLTFAALSFRVAVSDHFPGLGSGNVDLPPAPQRYILAFYSDADSTIYLPRGWSGRTPAELSMLVHEMVHHVQHIGHLSYPCPEARESMAYSAQSRWLQLFGRDLAGDFGIDRLTLRVSTTCPEWAD